MNDKKLNRKIALTNIRRIISSFLFINIIPIYNKFVLGTKIAIDDIKGVPVPNTCYAVGPQQKIKETNILIILVPIAIAIILIIGVIFGIKRHKKNKNKMEEGNSDKKD